MSNLAFVFSLLFSFSASAASIVENFSSSVYKGSGTLVWNIAQQTIHPTLQVKNWELNGGDQATDNFMVGDGRHGAFKLETYANFGSVSGTTITIDASVYPILQVTSFKLDSGYTLTAINGPLVIYSLSTVEVAGTIQCGGSNASGTTPGSGRCGGGNGGTGGAASQSGERGFPRTGSITAGNGGTYNSGTSGAGGGGGGSAAANGNSGSNDNVSNNTGGASGAGISDKGFSVTTGSAGGGGGSGSTVNAGGGGGGGAGNVIIHAVGDITVTGLINARGGNGASTTPGANAGGGGGGGGGGGIKLFTAGTITLQTGTPVNGTAGSQGTSADANAGAGGNGATGRTWLVYTTIAGTGTESPTTSLVNPGTFQYANAVAQTVISKGYDTRSTLASFQSISVSPSSADIAAEVAGSNDNFASDDSGWLPLAQISTLNNKRYVRFKITLTNSNASNPTKITGVTVTFTAGEKQDFNFKSSCGSVTGVPPPSTGTMMIMIVFLLLPFALGLGLRSWFKPVES